MTNQPSFVQYYPGYGQQQVQTNLRVQTITQITNAPLMVVTTERDHGYVAGMNVSFLIPIEFGMRELNFLNGQVLEITPNTLTVGIDSTNFSVFSYPSPLPSAYTPPSVIPNSSGMYLPPKPLPFGNQNSFEGVIYNDGAIDDPI